MPYFGNCREGKFFICNVYRIVCLYLRHGRVSLLLLWRSDSVLYRFGISFYFFFEGWRAGIGSTDESPYRVQSLNETWKKGSTDKGVRREVEFKSLWVSEKSVLYKGEGRSCEEEQEKGKSTKAYWCRDRRRHREVDATHGSLAVTLKCISEQEGP